MKWKSDLFNNIVRMGIYLLLWGVSSDMVAQEDVKRIVRRQCADIVRNTGRKLFFCFFFCMKIFLCRMKRL